MIEVSNLSKEFVLNRQQRKELNTIEKTALAHLEKLKHYYSDSNVSK